LRENALFNQMWRMVRAGKVWRGELVSKRKSGSLYDYQLTVAPVFDEKGKVSHFVAVQQDITKRKRAEHLLGQSRSKLREIHVRINGLREEERKQLSRNLHDHAGQFITALKFDIASASHNARSFPESEEKQVVLDKLASAQQLLGETHRDLARIAKTLRPAELNTSLLLALKAEIDQFAKRAKWKCSFNLPKKEMPLSDRAATMLFQIFQESITNVARHAGAKAVHVTLIVAADVLGLEIKDNGRGFSPERTGSSLGVLGMQERAGSLGGQVDIVTSDRGTSIKVSIPFSQNCT
jgi:signal transduction histidine kinase